MARGRRHAGRTAGAANGRRQAGAGIKGELRDSYRSRFKHADEHASPGYYSVELESAGGKKILAELTATERTGVHRYTFPSGEDAHLLLDFFHAYGTENPVEDADMRVIGNNVILGGRRVNKWGYAPPDLFCNAGLCAAVIHGGLRSKPAGERT